MNAIQSSPSSGSCCWPSFFTAATLAFTGLLFVI